MSTTKFRVAVLDDFEKLADSAPAYERLKSRADVTILRERLNTPEKLEQKLRDADCLLLMRERTRLGDKEFSLLPKLKFISQTGRTSKHLDMQSATRRGIAVAGTPSDNGLTTKELTIGLILALMRKIPLVDRRMREESWPPIAGLTLEGKTIGVLGFGRIGAEVARIMKVFNTRVVGYSRTLTPEKAAEVGAECVPLETLLRESDLVTLHVPLNANTRGMIGEKEIAMMKPGALLVNTSRGPLVSEQALVHALQTGRLGGAALDVFDTEPLPMEHPLRRLDNAILLPHRGYATVEILRQRYGHAMENILAFMDGKSLDLINPEVQAGKKP
ncbi:MAG TPA: D-2-hydroxyacid dehydrogenase family protein [Methylomirabilota bacterium]|nr:D-2-hydroxyacid dehydrogenase family protein [Methylomirabilota bacterium]